MYYKKTKCTANKIYYWKLHKCSNNDKWNANELNVLQFLSMFCKMTKYFDSNKFTANDNSSEEMGDSNSKWPSDPYFIWQHFFL